MRVLATALLLATTAGTALAFTDAEVRAIEAHGPWPMPWTRDASNRVSGKAQAIELGERLFFERRLSANGGMSCSRCHLPERNWSDGEARARGLALTDRNTPSVVNVRYQRWFGWDGANDSLWSQSIRPILDPRELGASASRVGVLLRGDRDLSCRYAKAFGGPPPADNEKVLIDAGKALAAFLETLVSGRTAFDEFRDALARGDRAAMARYPESARRGLGVFIGKGSCDTCHAGPAFTDGGFHDSGIPLEPAGVDPGRRGGIKKLLSSRYNLLGPYNDDPLHAQATGTQHVALEQKNFGEFKVPSLRKLVQTAPYMHDGSLATLRDVLNRHYSGSKLGRLRPDGKQIPEPLLLSERETEDLLAFLETLQDGGASYLRRPFPEDCR